MLRYLNSQLFACTWGVLFHWTMNRHKPCSDSVSQKGHSFTSEQAENTSDTRTLQLLETIPTYTCRVYWLCDTFVEAHQDRRYISLLCTWHKPLGNLMWFPAKSPPFQSLKATNYQHNLSSVATWWQGACGLSPSQVIYAKYKMGMIYLHQI